MNARLDGFYSVCRFKRLPLSSLSSCGPCELRAHHVTSPSLCAYVPGALSTPPNVRALKPGTSNAYQLLATTPASSVRHTGIYDTSCAARRAWRMYEGGFLHVLPFFVCTYMSVSLSLALLLYGKKNPRVILVTTDRRTTGNILWKGANFVFIVLVLLR